MKKIIFLILISSFLLTPSVFAEENNVGETSAPNQSSSISKNKKAGLTPDSPIYFLDTIGERMGMFFTFSKKKRAEKALKYAQEKIEEIKIMIARKKQEAINKATQRYEQLIELAQNEKDEAEKQGENIKEVFDKIVEVVEESKKVLEQFPTEETIEQEEKESETPKEKEKEEVKKVDICSEADISVYGLYYNPESEEINLYTENKGEKDLDINFYLIHNGKTEISFFSALANKITQHKIPIRHIKTFNFFQEISEMFIAVKECPNIKHTISAGDIKSSYEEMERYCVEKIDKLKDCPMANIEIEDVFFDERDNQLKVFLNNKGSHCLNVGIRFIHSAIADMQFFSVKENRITEHSIDMGLFGIISPDEISQVSIISQSCPQIKDSTTTIDYYCDDDNPCTIDSYNPTTKSCSNIAKDCDDNDLCTTERCDPISGSCIYSTFVCGDDDLCTFDMCDKGKCVNILRNCEDGDPTTTDYCDQSTGLCVHNISDTDGDGLNDDVDECPTQFGPSNNNGCPIIDDADGDGIIDSMDPCPNDYGPRINDGCPYGDYDGDGLTDDVDECPTQFGPSNNNGCPI